MRPVRRALAGLLVAFGTFALAGVAGATDSVFTVAGVPVDTTAQSATQARESAHRAGRRLALQILLQRMTLKDDWSNLPLPDDETLAGMEADIQINDERRSQNRYLATITYSFIPAQVRELLRQAGLRHSESQSRPMLVLPVIEERGQINLWDEPNPWLNAWSERKLSHELVPIEAPLRDLADISSIRAQDAVDLNWEALARIAQRYNRTEILVAHAVLSRDNDIARLDVTLTQVNETNTESLRTTVVGRVPSDLSEQPFDPSEDVYRKGVATSVDILNSAWKSLTLVDQSSVQRLRATVRFTKPDGQAASGGLKTWLEIRQKLSEVATIKETQVIALSAKGAEIDVIFLGSVDQLALNLGQANLVLSGARGYWEIGWRGTLRPELQGLNGQRPQIYRVDLPSQGTGLGPSNRLLLPAPDQGQGFSGQQPLSGQTPGGAEPLNGQMPLQQQPAGQAPLETQPATDPMPSGQFQQRQSYEPYQPTQPAAPVRTPQTQVPPPSGLPPAPSGLPPAPTEVDTYRQPQGANAAPPIPQQSRFSGTAGPAGFQAPTETPSAGQAQPHSPSGVRSGYGYTGGPRFQPQAQEPAPQPVQPNPATVDNMQSEANAEEPEYIDSDAQSDYQYEPEYDPQ